VLENELNSLIMDASGFWYHLYQQLAQLVLILRKMSSNKQDTHKFIQHTKTNTDASHYSINAYCFGEIVKKM